MKIYILVFLLMLPEILTAQFVQEGPKLVGTGSVGTSWQGYSVSLSSDGNTAIEGARADNSGMGGAWVYTRSAGVWTQQGSKLLGTGAVGISSQGTGVSISADGNTAIVGGPADNSTTGAAWIFVRSGGVWTQQGPKLIGTGAVGYAYQGYSVAISADGNTVILGGYFDNANSGAAWVFTRSGGVWTQQGSKLVGTGAIGFSQQGVSVALSSDGNTAMIGGWYDNNEAGSTWIFTRSGGVWSQQGPKLFGTGATGIAHQGYFVALSSDGNTALSGGYSDNLNSGAAWVFTRSGGVWSQQGTKLVGTGAVGNAWQGVGVGLSGDGNTAVVGGYKDNANAGAIWIFSRSGGIWSQLGSKITGTGAIGNAQQGTSVAISSDGSTIIEGAYADDIQKGAVWVFKRQFPFVLNLTAIIQGFYDSNTNSMIPDTMQVYLRNSTAPYSKVDSSKRLLSSSGTGTFNFTNAANGVNYYIVIKQRNSIETWSNTGYSFNSGSLTYNFSSNAAQSYGSNEAQIDTSPVRFGIFSGDVNQDGTVDLTDLISIYNDAKNFVSGYVNTDVTGDNFVDLTDVTITYNNSINFVSVIRP